MINGKTRLIGIFGWPISHTLSPIMHNAAFAALGLDYAYVPLPVHPDALPAAVQGFIAMGFAGANVTVPHKAAVVAHMDRLTPIAEAVGAVNTIIVEEGGTLLGDNTDGQGFIDDLRAHGVDPDGISAIVIGAGGAARAVVYVLAEAGATVAVANRSLPRAAELCERVASVLPGAHVSAHAFPGDLARLHAGANLIVNATSLGLHPESDALPWDATLPVRADQTVYDLIPSAQTPLQDLARRSGGATCDGIGMLIRQGAAAFTRWTGQPAPVPVMEQALRARLEAQDQRTGTSR